MKTILAAALALALAPALALAQQSQPRDAAPQAAEIPEVARNPGNAVGAPSETTVPREGERDRPGMGFGRALDRMSEGAETGEAGRPAPSPGTGGGAKGPAR